MAQTLDLGRVVGEQGPKGDPFEYTDFTAEQLENLRGPRGNQGDKGDPFTYEDFTEEQLAALTGPKGDKGDTGNTGAQGPKGDRGEDGVMTRHVYTLSFPAASWVEQEDGSYTQLATAEGMLATDYAHVDLDMSAVTAETYSAVQEAWALVARAQTQDGGLLLTCFDGAPEADLALKAEVIR